jgi:hypothetical protein
MAKDTPTREPVKTILKAPRVTFDPKNQPDLVSSIPNKDSIDEQVAIFLENILNYSNMISGR